MFRGFFDESNRNPDEAHFILAGWTTTVEEWERFSDDWNSCLLQTPLKGRPFHSRSKEFREMHVADREKTKIALATVICEHNLRGYVATARHEVLSGKPESLKKLMGTRIYDWAFIAIVPFVLIDYLERGERSRIDFIFDGCTELRACIESYEREKQNWTPSMQAAAGTVISGDDAELNGLQAADLLAGEHSIFMNTRTREAPYLKLLEAGIPIKEVEARPPLMQLNALLQYSREVQNRAELVKEFINLLKANGLTVNDLKAKLDDLEKQ